MKGSVTGFRMVIGLLIIVDLNYRNKCKRTLGLHLEFILK